MPKLHPLLSLLLTIFVAWSLISFMQRSVGTMILILLLTLIGLICLACWMLRFRRQQLVRIYAHPIGKFLLDLVCRLTGDQPPVESSGSAKANQRSEPELIIDTETATKQLHRSVRGHRATSRRLVEHFAQACTLRRRSTKNSSHRPLACYALLGAAGAGKTHLSVEFAARVYRGGKFLCFRFGEHSSETALFGSEGKNGDIVEAVRRQPKQVICISGINRADAHSIAWLQQLLLHGRLADRARGTSISFRKCVIFLTADLDEEPASPLNDLGSRQASAFSPGDDQALRKKLLQLDIPSRLVENLDAAFLMHRPSRIERAEIVLLTILRHCRDYDVALRRVDPEVLFTEVKAAERAGDFQNLPGRIKNLLHEPIVQASVRNRGYIDLLAPVHHHSIAIGSSDNE